MKSKTTKYFLFAFSLIAAALVISSCRTDEVDIPPLTGPSGARLFITMEATNDHLLIKGPGRPRESSRVCAQLKNQQGQGVPGETIKFRIANKEGTEVNIGTLDRLAVGTDAGGFACVTYTAPNTAEQPVPTRIYILAILVNPSYTFEVTGRHAIDLEAGLPPTECVFGGPGAPVADFTANPDPGVEDQQVCFDAQASTDNGIIVAASWDFGDGGTATGLVACHTFTSDGLFNVTLLVQDEDRNCDTITQVFEVGVGGAPSCVFTVSPNPVNTDTTVFFDATGSSDPEGDSITFRWDFGDGSSANGAEVTHMYDDEGTFTVELTVRDSAGNETTCTQTVTVASGLPTCEFTIDPNPADLNEEVTFDASASEDLPPGTIVAFDWDFDENGTFGGAPPDKSGEVVTQSFVTPGTIVIGLRVTDNDGNAVTCFDTLTIGTPPTCSIDSVSDDEICTGDSVDFEGSGSDPDGGAVTFDWDFGDGGTSSQEDPTHVFNTANLNTIVTLTVTDDEGLTCEESVTIAVQGDPTITQVSPSVGPVGANVTITGTNFRSAADGGTVTFFNGVAQPVFSVNASGTQITTTVPAGATDGPITVANECGSANSLPFDVCGALSITGPADTGEGDGGGSTPFNFTVSTDNTCSLQQSATFTAQNGGPACGVVDATEDNDFDAGSPPTGPANIAPNTGSTIVTIQIDADDAVDGVAMECFTVTISGPVNATLGSPTAADGTILNDPDPVVP